MPSQQAAEQPMTEPTDLESRCEAKALEAAGLRE